MGRYALRRILQMIPVMIGVTLVVFLTMRVLPGDPVRLMLRDLGATEQQLAEFRTEMGLDRPLLVQYANYFSDIVRGDFHDSFSMRQPVLDVVMSRLPATIELAASALLVAVVFGIGAGLLAAVYRNSVIDYTTTFLATIGVSLPSFWIGLMLILYLSAGMQLLPGFGRLGDSVQLEAVTGFHVLDSILTLNGAALASALLHLVLPALALAIVMATYIARVVRASMMEVLDQDYVRTATSKGLASPTIIFSHALRNALLPVVTLIGIQFGNLLSGAIVVETIFAWPGLGRLVVDAIYQRDFPLVQGAVILFAFVRLVLNLLTDLVYARIDPRISYA